jgi:hypothetical protein
MSSQCGEALRWLLARCGCCAFPCFCCACACCRVAFWCFCFAFSRFCFAFSRFCSPVRVRLAPGAFAFKGARRACLGLAGAPNGAGPRGPLRSVRCAIQSERKPSPPLSLPAPRPACLRVSLAFALVLCAFVVLFRAFVVLSCAFVVLFRACVAFPAVASQRPCARRGWSAPCVRACLGAALASADVGLRFQRAFGPAARWWRSLAPLLRFVCASVMLRCPSSMFVFAFSLCVCVAEAPAAAWL